MKRISIYMLIVVMLFGAISCEEKLDINTDPLAASSPELILPAVLARYQSRKETELGTRIMDVSQHFSACFNSPRQGVTTSFLTGNTWGMYYTIMLGNLDVLETGAREAGELQNNVTGIAITLKALAFYELSMIFEDIPFTEALNAQEFPTPRFDDQETVLKGTVDMLDEAVSFLTNVPAGATVIGGQDFIYNGDVTLWERFANSLQLRILMLIRTQDPGYALPRINDVLSRPLITDLSHVASFPFFETVGQQNSFADLNNTFFGTPSNEVTGVYAPSPVLRDLLVDNDDPRTNIFLTDINTADGEEDDFDNPPMGSFSFGAFGAVISDVVSRYDYPAVWYTPAEVSFYRAELALDGDVSGDADALTQEGVTFALEYWGGAIDNARATIDPADIAAFAGTFTGVTKEQLYEQMYLETFMRPIVAWNHVRRTRVPVLTEVPGTNISDFLQRFTYAPDETATNPFAPVNPLTDARMWFAQ